MESDLPRNTTATKDYVLELLLIELSALIEYCGLT